MMDPEKVDSVYLPYLEEGFQKTGGAKSLENFAIVPGATCIIADDVEKARRILTLQFWRNIGPAVMDYPLCFCDSRSVTRDELSPILVAEYGGLTTQFEAFAVNPPKNDAHKWYTFPAMKPDEVVVFRAFDSDRVTSGKPFWTPHSAFLDPTAPAPAPARESIEMRAICLFKGE
jgi:hypothetical protein